MTTPWKANTQDRQMSFIPMLQTLRRRRYERYFANAHDVHIFRGVYDSFEGAAASAPSTKPLTYDNAEAASMYDSRLRADAYDYPVMLWLQRSFNEGMRRVFDIGGNVGIKFYAFRRLVDFPDDVSWLIEDMPAVIEHGRSLAATRNDSGPLRFTGRHTDGDGAELLLALGSLQYLPLTLAELLADMQHPPLRIIINTTPIHIDRSFFTLNNIGTAFCPYRVQSRGDFLGSISRAGYRLRDHWDNPGKAMHIPFASGYDVDAYSGFCFDCSIH
jgi:putative methyltransferase (TIGR04325 family)